MSGPRKNPFAPPQVPELERNSCRPRTYGGFGPRLFRRKGTPSLHSSNAGIDRQKPGNLICRFNGKCAARDWMGSLQDPRAIEAVTTNCQGRRKRKNKVEEEGSFVIRNSLLPPLVVMPLE